MGPHERPSGRATRRLGRLRLSLVLAACVWSWQTDALADDGNGTGGRADEATEHSIVLGVGGTTEVELGSGALHAGANVMVEWEAVENWLELEVGASVLSVDHGVQIPIDLLVKKPFTLAPWAEFMVVLVGW